MGKKAALRRQRKEEARQHSKAITAMRRSENFKNRVVTKRELKTCLDLHRECLGTIESAIRIVNETDFAARYWMAAAENFADDVKDRLHDYWKAIGGATAHISQVASTLMLNCTLLEASKSDFDRVYTTMGVAPMINELYSLVRTLQYSAKGLIDAERKYYLELRAFMKATDKDPAQTEVPLPTLVLDFDKIDVEELVAYSMRYRELQHTTLASVADIENYLDITTQLNKIVQDASTIEKVITECTVTANTDAPVQSEEECPAVTETPSEPIEFAVVEMQPQADTAVTVENEQSTTVNS